MLTLDTEIPRDRWGRPVLDGLPYTRASTIAGVLDDQYNLTKWHKRMTAIGLASSPDLIAEVATTDAEDKQALDAVCEKALDRAGAGSAARLGTAIHTASVVVDEGRPTKGLPAELVADANAYQRFCKDNGLVPLAAEVFVANRDLAVAGSFDRLMAGPKRNIIVDLKTSSKPGAGAYKALAWSIQLAVYAHGKPWSPTNGFCEWADLKLPEPDLERGLVLSIVQGSAEVEAYSVDLRAGWEAAHTAVEVYKWRKHKDLVTKIN